ncbi:hypothetical protein [Microbacterium album]|uniref:Uncharacterized protein n=1 Tax=Microbacterium album TaxID=2053191 RepID=A0A917IE00_9MICO|nr:hypothetical protein [Microbacterium album]GGH43386.1 hypothetical protein GCM10010921_17240 [Microbacterium album]
MGKHPATVSALVIAGAAVVVAGPLLASTISDSTADPLGGQTARAFSGTGSPLRASETDIPYSVPRPELDLALLECESELIVTSASSYMSKTQATSAENEQIRDLLADLSAHIGFTAPSTVTANTSQRVANSSDTSAATIFTGVSTAGRIEVVAAVAEVDGRLTVTEVAGCSTSAATPPMAPDAVLTPSELGFPDGVAGSSP